MECSICLSEITAATGIYTTSCGHSYHLRCAIGWLCQQNEKDTCPMCRHEFGELERLPPGEDIAANEEDEEDEEDEDEEDEDEEDEDYEGEEEEEDDIPAFDDAVHALWVMRTTFEMLDDGRSISPNDPEPPPLPRVIIQLPPTNKSFQVFRGHDSLEYVRSRSRRHAFALTWLPDDRGYESD